MGGWVDAVFSVLNFFPVVSITAAYINTQWYPCMVYIVYNWQMYTVIDTTTAVVCMYIVKPHPQGTLAYIYIYIYIYI